MWTTALWYHPMWQLQWGTVLGASLAAAICDVRTRKIPNVLTGTLFCGGLILAAGVRGREGLVDALMGCFLLGLPCGVLFVFGGGGAGDAKLLGALGVWLGVLNGAAVLVAVSGCGAVLALGYAWGKRRLGMVGGNLQAMGWGFGIWLAGHGRQGGSRELIPARGAMLTMPYGPAIFLGSCLAAGGMMLWRH